MEKEKHKDSLPGFLSAITRLIKIFSKIIKNIIPYRIKAIYYKFLSKLNLVRKLKPKKVLNFEVHLTDHCNLNCKGCNHFSSISDEIFLDTNSFKNDCMRIAELTGGHIGNLLLLGGEPLLHPNVNEIMEISRASFVMGNISILTNGLLLMKQPKEFWQSCKENDIKVIVTKYPIKLNFQEIGDKAEKEGVKMEFFGNTGIEEKKMFREPLDLSGKQDPITNFKKCYKANDCITLKEGKLYTCTVPPHINHFNKYFNLNLQVSENDYIDIYKAKSLIEIMNFLCKPIPFCRYCKLDSLSGFKWSTSKKEISEWT